jgi:hypothetical protein
MSLMPIVEGEAFQHMEEIIKRHLKGHSPLKIARDLNIKMVEVSRNIEQWREIARADQESRDTVRDRLNEMVIRYDTLIKEANDNLTQLKELDFNEKQSTQILASIRLVADLDKSRVDLMQKAGLLDNTELGNELAEREAREEALIKILRDDLCPDCKMVVARKLQALTNEVEVIQVFDE